MDYLKVPELPKLPNGYTLPFTATQDDELYWSVYDGSKNLVTEIASMVADLINAVYTPTTGLLAQIEDQKRVIEELRGKVEAMSTKH